MVFLTDWERQISGREGKEGRKTALQPCWCCKPSQPQLIISGQTEAFIERYILERTSKAEIRPEEQSEKVESCRENLWSEIQLKRP